MFEWDEAKRRTNLAKHGIDFADVEGFDFETALIGPDERQDYGERRFIALGFLDGRLHVLVFTMRGDVRWLISLRKANAREVRFHGNES